MTKGEQLTLAAMRKEFKRLSRVADKAKAEVEECINITTEMLAINQEFIAIIDSGEYGQTAIDKLDALKKRRKRAEAIFNKDIIKLSEKKAETAGERDALGSEIQMMEFKFSLRSGEIPDSNKG